MQLPSSSKIWRPSLGLKTYNGTASMWGLCTNMINTPVNAKNCEHLSFRTVPIAVPMFWSVSFSAPLVIKMEIQIPVATRLLYRGVLYTTKRSTFQSCFLSNDREYIISVCVLWPPFCLIKSMWEVAYGHIYCCGLAYNCTRQPSDLSQFSK